MWNSNATIEDIIRQVLMGKLSIEGQWIGNPGDSTFGIMIGLKWNGNLFGSTIINFLEENC